MGEPRKREGSPFYWCDFTVRGRRFRESSGCEGKREARAYEARRRSEEEASVATPGRWRVRQVLGAYWSDKAERTTNAATTWGQLARLSDGIGPDVFAADIDAPMVLRFRAAHRFTKPKHPREKVRPRSVATLNRDCETLRAAMRHAERVHGQAMPSIPWLQVMEREPKPPIRYAARPNLDRLLACCDPEMRRAVLFAVVTGLRLGNVRGLEWERVDLAAGRARMRVKGGAVIEARLSPPVIATLAVTPPDARKGYVFNRVNFRKRWERARRDAGLPGVRFHDLRHTFAAYARMNGADIAALKDAMHHQSIATTMRYAGITPDDARTAWDAVGEAFAVRVFDERKVG